MPNQILPKEVPATNPFFIAWNSLLAWCKKNTLQSSSDILVNQTTNGTSLTLVKKASSQAVSPNNVQTYMFVSDGGDYINTNPSGSLVSSSFIKVAKPYKIRTSIGTETLNDGSGVHTYTYTAITSSISSGPASGSIASYTRTNTWGGGSGGTENERIVPPYLYGDLIYCAVCQQCKCQ